MLRRLASAPAAFLGTLLVMLALDGIGVVPLVGGVIPLLVTTVALGAVLLTRLGTRIFVPDTIGDMAPSVSSCGSAG